MARFESERDTQEAVWNANGRRVPWERAFALTNNDVSSFVDEHPMLRENSTF